MMTNTERLWRNGIPEGTIISTIPNSSYWMEMTAIKKGFFKVSVMNPEGTDKKTVWESMPQDKLNRLIRKLANLGTLYAKNSTNMAKLLKKQAKGIKTKKTKKTKKAKK
jgi:hypothetical protein